MKARQLVLPLLFLSGVGCGPTYRFSSSVAQTPDPRTEECNFHLVDAWPYPGYHQIGVVEYDGSFGSSPTTDHGEFWNQIQAEVCRGGGEVVIAQINGLGWYVRGIVLARVPGAPPAQPGTPAAAPPPPADGGAI